MKLNQNSFNLMSDKSEILIVC